MPGTKSQLGPCFSSNSTRVHFPARAEVVFVQLGRKKDGPMKRKKSNKQDAKF
jgi:hypothetical protein